MTEEGIAGTGPWAVIEEELASHDDCATQLARYRYRSRMAPALFLVPERDVAMFASWSMESRDRVRAAVVKLPDDALPRAMAHAHPLLRRIAVGEKARRLLAGG